MRIYLYSVLSERRLSNPQPYCFQMIITCSFASTLRIRFIGLSALFLTGTSGLWAQDDAEEVFELSPFSIDAEDSDGLSLIHS